MDIINTTVWSILVSKFCSLLQCLKTNFWNFKRNTKVSYFSRFILLCLMWTVMSNAECDIFCILVVGAVVDVNTKLQWLPAFHPLTWNYVKLTRTVTLEQVPRTSDKYCEFDVLNLHCWTQHRWMEYTLITFHSSCYNWLCLISFQKTWTLLCLFLCKIKNDGREMFVMFPVHNIT